VLLLVQLDSSSKLVVFFLCATSPGHDERKFGILWNDCWKLSEVKRDEILAGFLALIVADPSRCMMA